MDMPEDLSAKYKSVSVQTEKWGKYIFEDLFDGFSQKQMKTFITILDKFVAKKDNEHIADREQLAPEYCKVRIFTKPLLIVPLVSLQIDKLIRALIIRYSTAYYSVSTLTFDT